MNRPFSHLRVVGFWLALLGVTLRALLPVGFMPMTDRSGGMVLVLCTGQGAQTVRLDDRPQPVKSLAVHAEQCPFGFALSMGAPPSATVPFEFERHTSVTSTQPQVLSAFVSVPGWYTSRGPPRLS